MLIELLLLIITYYKANIDSGNRSVKKIGKNFRLHAVYSGLVESKQK